MGWDWDKMGWGRDGTAWDRDGVQGWMGTGRGTRVGMGSEWGRGQEPLPGAGFDIPAYPSLPRLRRRRPPPGTIHGPPPCTGPSGGAGPNPRDPSTGSGGRPPIPSRIPFPGQPAAVAVPAAAPCPPLACAGAAMRREQPRGLTWNKHGNTMAVAVSVGGIQGDGGLASLGCESGIPAGTSCWRAGSNWNSCGETGGVLEGLEMKSRIPLGVLGDTAGA